MTTINIPPKLTICPEVFIGAWGAARRYRDQNPELSAGVVLVYGGEAYGWKNAVRDPQDERPCAFAVDEFSNTWIAQGGDDHNGATHWQQVCFAVLP